MLVKPETRGAIAGLAGGWVCLFVLLLVGPEATGDLAGSALVATVATVPWVPFAIWITR